MNDSWWLKIISNPKNYVNAWNDAVKNLRDKGKIVWINSRWRVA